MPNYAIPVPNDYNSLPTAMSEELYAALRSSGVNLTGHESVLPTFTSLADIPANFTGTAQVGTQLYVVNDGVVRNTGPFYAQSNIPLILLSSATAINATGAITGLTAIPTVPLGTVVRVYCFAQSGLTAGVYYAIFSSPTACQLYTNVAGTIKPTGITAAAYASGTAAVTIPLATISGGSLGANGSLRVRWSLSSVNNANNKWLALMLGGVIIHQPGWISLPWLSLIIYSVFINRGLQNVNQSMPFQNNYFGVGYVSQAFVPSTIDTSIDKVLSINLQMQAATDYLVLESYLAETSYSA